MSNLRPLGATPSKRSVTDYQHPRYSSVAHAVTLPDEYLVPNQAPIKDQGQTPTCVGHALEGLMEQATIKRKIQRALSVLAGYVGARSLENPPPAEGASIRDALIFAQRYGIPPAADWPLDNGNGKPTRFAAARALLTRITGWAEVGPATADLKACLVRTQANVIVGILVTPGFDTVGPDGLVSPGGNDRGYHAVNIAGYSEKKQAFLVRNSWGVEWADKGYCWVPYAMMRSIIGEAYTAGVLVLDEAPATVPWWAPVARLFGWAG